ncbi:alpha/beta hydrolase [Streptomyces sp. ODS28]|uniref:alpha/beta fold hydrolase n=1 Tax=Streptomyces sp. ODS28 TaxID=3136688 RepID=UPI0031F00E5D
MTAFVMVAGGHTGGWVWRDVAAALRERGHEVYPATLTGLGDRRHLAGPGTDLETHIEDLVQIIDHVDEPDVVLVGHCYGIYPVVGAADRRPGRVVHTVYLDAALPQDGRSMLDQVREQMADPEARAHILGHAAEGARRADLLVPPPTLEEWRTAGNTGDVPADVVERLARRAAPQPLRTFDQPLRLEGPEVKLPLTGIFCTGNGTTLAMVEELVATGAPRFRPLTDPRATFFELDTGHWPMLSAPDELTDVLLRGIAGEGHRIAPAAAA